MPISDRAGVHVSIAQFPDDQPEPPRSGMPMHASPPPSQRQQTPVAGSQAGNTNPASATALPPAKPCQMAPPARLSTSEFPSKAARTDEHPSKAARTDVDEVSKKAPPVPTPPAAGAEPVPGGGAAGADLVVSWCC